MLTYTVVNPRTMMIILGDTSVTDITVIRSGRFVLHTTETNTLQFNVS
jgi:hypothetical protein